MTESNQLAQNPVDIKDYLNLRYPLTLEPSEDGGYLALIKDLPGCITDGETQEEALNNLEEARILWIETAYKYKDSIPLPTTEVKFGGKFLLRMPRSLHQKLAESAKLENVSLNKYIEFLLTEKNVKRQNISKEASEQKLENLTPFVGILDNIETNSKNESKPEIVDIKDYLNLRYPLTLEPSEDGGYLALIKDLPGCITDGETQEEALNNLEEARILWIETAYKYNDSIPLPTTDIKFGGKFLLRMPPSLHQKLAERAERENVSLNQYIVFLLTEKNVTRQNVSGKQLEDLIAYIVSLLSERNITRHNPSEEAADKKLEDIIRFVGILGNRKPNPKNESKTETKIVKKQE